MRPNAQNGPPGLTRITARSDSQTPGKAPNDVRILADDALAGALDASDVDAVISLSDERDRHQRRWLAAWREGYVCGRAAGIAQGRELESADRDEQWNALAR